MDLIWIISLLNKKKSSQIGSRKLTDVGNGSIRGTVQEIVNEDSERVYLLEPLHQEQTIAKIKTGPIVLLHNNRRRDLDHQFPGHICLNKHFKIHRDITEGHRVQRASRTHDRHLEQTL